METIIKSANLFRKKVEVVKFCTIVIKKQNNSYVLIVTNGILGQTEKTKEYIFDSYNKTEKEYNEIYEDKINNKYTLNYDECVINETIDDITIDDINIEIKFLLNLISNEEIIKKVLEQIGIDPKLMPIEKINKKRIDGAYEILYKLNTNNYDVNCDNYKDLIEAYYRYIPYVTNKNINKTEIKTFIDNLDIVKNIYDTYSSIIKHKNKSPSYMKPIFIYKSLDIDIKLLDNIEDKNEFCNIFNIINNNPLIINNIKYIYKLHNKKQRKIYEENTSNISNKKLLFHGSPITNWFSILKNGFYIDSKKVGVPVNGKAYGDGVYFSDSSSYSYDYCNNKKYDNTEFLLLGICEVALCEKSHKASPIFVIFNTNQYDFKYLICIDTKKKNKINNI